MECVEGDEVSWTLCCGGGCAQHTTSEFLQLILAVKREKKLHCTSARTVQIKPVAAGLAFAVFESNFQKEIVSRFKDEDSPEEYKCIPAN